MKYMVMECHLTYAVVLDEDGKFQKVANLHYEVGQTLEDVVEMQQPQQEASKKKGNKWVYSLVAMASCLMLVLTSLLQARPITYGSVYLSINPAIRIDVDQDDVVVGLKETNEDGKTLIKDYNYKKKNLDLVMNDLVDLAIAMDYLREGGQINVTLDGEDQQWVRNHSETIPVRMDAHIPKDMKVTITIADAKSEEYEAIIPVFSNQEETVVQESTHSPQESTEPESEVESTEPLAPTESPEPAPTESPEPAPTKPPTSVPAKPPAPAPTKPPTPAPTDPPVPGPVPTNPQPSYNESDYEERDEGNHDDGNENQSNYDPAPDDSDDQNEPDSNYDEDDDD